MSDTITPRLRIKAQPEVAVRAKAVPPPKVRLRVLPSLMPMQIELQNTGTMVQWRYLGEDWQDLIAITDIDTTVTVGTVTTLPPGSPATVVNVGTAQDMVLNFGIPAGIQGIQGNAATIAVGTTTTVSPATPAAVANVGTPNDAVFNFSIPQGAAATVAVGTVSTLAPGASATVVNVGTSGAAVLDFGIPRGASGIVSSVVAGTNVTVDGTDPANPIVTAAGNVSGPASAVDNRVATFNGTTGKLLKDSGVVLGNVASRNVGTTAGTAAAGDDSRFSTVPDDYVTNAKLANMANATVKGRNTAGTGDPEDVTMSQLKTLAALNNVDNTSDATKFAATAGRIGGVRAVAGTTDTFVLGDAGTLVYSSGASATAFTIPPNSSVAFPAGTTVINVGQAGAGELSIAPGSGVTLNSVSTRRKLNAQYSTAALVKIATDTWWLFGDIKT